MLHKAVALEGGDVQLDLGIPGGVPVDGEQRQGACFFVVGGCRVHIGQALLGRVLRGVVYRVGGQVEGVALHRHLQGLAAAVLHQLVEGVVRGRAPDVLPVGGAKGPQAAGHAANLHPVRVAQEGQQNAGAAQGRDHVPHLPAAAVHHVVRVVADVGGVGVEAVVGVVQVIGAPAGVLYALEGAHHGAVLVEGEHQLAGGAHLGLDKVAQGRLGLDVVLDVRRAAQQLEVVPRGGGVVVVQRDVVHGVVALLQHLQIPLGEVPHKGGGGAAHRRLDGAVHPLHGLGGLVGQDAVALGVLLPGGYLPGAVHLVAQVPGLYAVGLLPAVLAAQIGPIGAAGMVGVLGDVDGVQQGAGAQVDGVHGLGANLFRPLQVLVVAHVVGDVLVPGQIQVGLALLLGADGVLPLPAGDKVAPGQPQGGQARFPQGGDEVLAEALAVRSGVLGVVHAAVDHGADGLQKGAVQPGRDFPNGELGVQRQFRCFCHCNSSQKSVAPAFPAGARCIWAFPRGYCRWYSRKSKPISVEKPSTVSRR